MLIKSHNNETPVLFSASGGGSGGSVWINTGYLRGHGSVLATGAASNIHRSARGGSGSGGRIAVHIQIKDEYRGGFYALGGVGSGNQHGGSGTVYIEEARGDKFYRRLYINNQNAKPVKEFKLDQRNPRSVRSNGTEENGADYAFDELMLEGQVRKFVFNASSLKKIIITRTFPSVVLIRYNTGCL